VALFSVLLRKENVPAEREASYDREISQLADYSQMLREVAADRGGGVLTNGVDPSADRARHVRNVCPQVRQLAKEKLEYGTA
jgi:hypothetical protein